jgi:hypothetical protein
MQKNNQWLRPLLLRVGSFTTEEQAEIDLNEVESAILSKLESIEQEARIDEVKNVIGYSTDIRQRMLNARFHELQEGKG